MRVQFNTRISKSVLQKVRRERTAKITNDLINEVALEAFFGTYTGDQRLSFYRNHTFKPYEK